MENSHNSKAGIMGEQFIAKKFFFFSKILTYKVPNSRQLHSPETRVWGSMPDSVWGGKVAHHMLKLFQDNSSPKLCCVVGSTGSTVCGKHHDFPILE